MIFDVESGEWLNRIDEVGYTGSYIAVAEPSSSKTRDRKTHIKKQARKLCDDLCRNVVKLRDGGRCRMCGKEYKMRLNDRANDIIFISMFSGAYLNWAHIVPRRDSASLRCDPRNGLSLCPIPCHDEFDRGGLRTKHDMALQCRLTEDDWNVLMFQKNKSAKLTAFEWVAKVELLLQEMKKYDSLGIDQLFEEKINNLKTVLS